MSTWLIQESKQQSINPLSSSNKPPALQILAMRAVLKDNLDNWKVIAPTCSNQFQRNEFHEILLEQAGGQRIVKMLRPIDCLELMLYQVKKIKKFRPSKIEKFQQHLHASFPESQDSQSAVDKACLKISELVKSMLIVRGPMVNRLMDKDLLEWKEVIIFLVRWRVQPFAVSEYERIAQIWACLWAETVQELNTAADYPSQDIEDPYIAALIGFDHLDPEKPVERCYRRDRFYKLSPLCCAIRANKSSAMTTDKIGANPFLYQLLYKYGERPWGHELSTWIDNCHDYPNLYTDEQLRSITTLLCKTGCIEALCKYRLARFAYCLTWKLLCEAPLILLKIILQYFPSEHFDLLENPSNTSYSMLCQAVEVGTIDHIQCLIQFYRQHGLWTPQVYQRAAGCTDNPEKKNLLYTQAA